MWCQCGAMCSCDSIAGTVCSCYLCWQSAMLCVRLILLVVVTVELQVALCLCIHDCMYMCLVIISGKSYGCWAHICGCKWWRVIWWLEHCQNCILMNYFTLVALRHGSCNCQAVESRLTMITTRRWRINGSHFIDTLFLCSFILSLFLSAIFIGRLPCNITTRTTQINKLD